MVAKVIVDHPGLEAFEPFRDLNVKSLLYYQAELDMLRKQLRKMELKDNQNPPVSNGGPLDCAASVADLLDTKCLPEGSRAQLDLITEIRNVLNKYSALSTAISVLSTLHSNAKTLGIIALFTVAFAGGLMYLVGGSSRVEIFTATAATLDFYYRTLY
ncbi:hypothetical protein M7I_8186 [Glarea lozoyensis 74030]|uniref:DUF6594 domain-containing protein n=1 Tax=Glarea lozoyensis (strain ATCC 74030 / MF5533) TaxID=1104152 RepID=H0EZC3_GLAL7|nr:hypothetical protein M7I_8186 [Glarea lozoyensis 74030]